MRNSGTLSTPAPVRIDRDTHADGHAVVRAHGELDLLTTPALAEAIDEALTGAPNVLVIDLTGSTFCGTPVVAALIDATRKANGATTLRIAGDRVLGRVLALAEPDQVPALFPTLGDALAERPPG